MLQLVKLTTTCRAGLVIYGILLPIGHLVSWGKGGTARGKASQREKKNYAESQSFSGWLCSRITWRVFKTSWSLDPALGGGGSFGIEWVPASAHFKISPVKASMLQVQNPRIRSCQSVWSADWQYQHDLGACQKGRISGPVRTY